MLSLISLSLALVLPASANSTGKTGLSTSGCASCHGNSADANVTASFNGPTRLTDFRWHRCRSVVIE